MDLNEMHVWFRQYAQQMGMQNVRAILPEQIDIVINTSISDTVNEIVRNNVGLTNDRIITDNSKIGQLNALRTLIKQASLEIATLITSAPNVNFKSIDFERFLQRFRIEAFTRGDESKISDCLYLIDLSIQYGIGQDLYWNNVVGDYKFNPGKLEDSLRTSYYPVRFIENMYLADTLQDSILKPRFRSPVATLNTGVCKKITYDVDDNDNVIKRETVSNGDIVDIYLGDDIKQPKSIGTQVFPSILLVNYIAKPDVVQYREDFGQPNVNCNLPDYMHVDILKHAVDLYRVAVQGSLYANQQQQQAQQREIGRNNVRPDNEGYTQ